LIVEQQATVYLAPTKGRRYLTKRAAIHNEARARIFKVYPIEDHPCREYSEYGQPLYPDEYFNIEEERPEYFQRKYKLLVNILKRY